MIKEIVLNRKKRHQRPGGGKSKHGPESWTETGPGPRGPTTTTNCQFRPNLIKAAGRADPRPRPLGQLVRLALVLAALASAQCEPDPQQNAPPPPGQAGPNPSPNPNASQLTQLQQRTVIRRRPDSSSSLFADVEDLSDSSIRTRLGKITIDHLGDSPDDFDALIERLVPDEATGARWPPPAKWQPGQQRQQQQMPPMFTGNDQPQLKVSADANNRTTMRFFRNSKTFASIVYTNPIQEGKRQVRRLINCHLVDLEKHSSDVAIYEAKYDIQTLDVEFRQMMQLIEACTNIARLRRRPGGLVTAQQQQQHQQLQLQQLAGGIQPLKGQIFAPPAGPAEGVSGKATSSAASQREQSAHQAGLAPPVVVVGRPVLQLPVGGSPQAPSGGPQQSPGQSSTTTSTTASTTTLAQFNRVMSGALDRELERLGPTLDDSARLDLPGQAAAFTEMHNHPTESGPQASAGGSATRAQAESAQAARHRHMKRVSHHDHAHQAAAARRERRRFEPMAPLFGGTTNNNNNLRLLYGPQVAPRNQSSPGQQQRQQQVVISEPAPLEQRLASSYQSALRTFKRQLSSHPLVRTISRVSEASKKLVLGEVTAPPELLGGSTRRGRPGGGGSGAGSGSSRGGQAGGQTGKGSVREAIEEISSYDTSDLLSIWRGILPGTNWCGMGDRATSYNDLGFESDIDICCRAHDFCPIRLSAFSSGYGLFNWSFYTRSHCWCDQNFLDCLQQAESPLSTVVMKFYFTIMKTTCLTDNETSNALEHLGSSLGSRHGPSQSSAQNLAGGLLNLGGGGAPKVPSLLAGLVPPSPQRAGDISQGRASVGLLKLIEQQAVAAVGGTQQQTGGPDGKAPNEWQQQAHMAPIPAHRNSQVLQNRYDRQQVRAQQ